jgi:hypothetical protein
MVEYNAQPAIISNTLKALLLYSKTPTEYGYEINGLAEALSDIYALDPNDFNITDLTHIVLKAYYEALAEPRFKLGLSRDQYQIVLDLVKVPFIGLNGEYVTQRQGWYEAFTLGIISELAVSVIDWCRDDVGLSLNNHGE